MFKNHFSQKRKQQQNSNDPLLNQQQSIHQIEHTAQKLDYDRFRIPPDLEICRLHQKSTIFGFDSSASKQSCPCCHQNIKEELQFKEASVRNIYKINQPMGFYFTFIKSMLLALLIILLLPGVYSIVWIINNCGDGPSVCDNIYGIPFPRLSTYYSGLPLAINSITILALYVIVAFLFYWNVLIHEKIAYFNQRASDYHSFVSGFDSSFISQDQLRQSLAEFQVEQVIYTYKIKKIMKLLSQKHILVALKNKYHREHETRKEVKMIQKIKKIDQKLIPIKNLFELRREKQLRTDKIIIKFRTKRGKKDFQEHYLMSTMGTVFSTLCRKSDLVISNCNLFVQRLGDPREILWENLEVSSSRRYIYVMLNNLALIVILGLSFYAVLSISFSKEQLESSQQAFLSLAFSVVILAINVVMGIYVNLTAQLEGKYTLTAQIESRIIKKIIAYFLNTTLTPFALLIIESYRPEQSESEIVQNILTLFLVGGLLVPLISSIVQIPHFIKLYKRKKIISEDKNSLKTQIKANLIFENNEFDLEDYYGLLCSRLTNCFFYAAIFPIGALITGAGLVLTYFASKYILIKYSSIPKLSFRLGILITKIAALFPLIYSLGFVLNLFTYVRNTTLDNFYSVALLAISIPITLIFLIKGHQLARRFIKTADLQTSVINITPEVSYKDLNPATFFFCQADQAEASSTQILTNMANFLVFQQEMLIWRLSRGALMKDIHQFQNYRLHNC